MNFCNFIRLSALQSCALLALHALALPAQAALDTKAPVLTGFGVTGAVDASRSGQTISVRLNASDNLTGVYYYAVEIVSPSGRVIRQEGYNPPSTRKFNTNVVIGSLRYANIEIGEHFDRWSEPGIWSVNAVDIRDRAGNAIVIERNALALLGNTEFVVSNDQADAVAPTIISGKVDTPTLSISTSAPGMPAGTGPLAVVTVTVQDTGSPTASGVDVYSAQYCKLPFDGTDCADGFGVVGTTGTPTKGATPLKMSGRLVRNDGTAITPGVYQLLVVSLADIAGNTVGYVSTQFGGSSDLDALFGGASSITINP